MRYYRKHLPATYGSHHAISTEIQSQIIHKIPAFSYPIWYSKWDDVLQIETSIACEVFQNLSHSLDVYRRWKVLLTASIGYLWITQYHRLQRLALKLHKSGSFEDLSVH